MQISMVKPKEYPSGLAKASHVALQMVRYGCCSVAALAIDVGILYVLTDYAGVNYLVAASCAFMVGLITNYLLGVMYVFTDSKYIRSKEFSCYAGIGLIGLVVNDVIMFLLVGAGLWYMYAKALSTVAVFFYNFLFRRRLFND